MFIPECVLQGPRKQFETGVTKVVMASLGGGYGCHSTTTFEGNGYYDKYL